MVHDCIEAGIVPIITTGRDAAFRLGQLTFLRRWAIPIDPANVFGRQVGDPRRDSIVKHEILHKEILPRFNPVLAVDDRPVVAQVWRDHGIRTIDVIDPHIDPLFLLTDTGDTAT